MTEVEFTELLFKELNSLGNGVEWIEPHTELGIKDDDSYAIQKIIERVNIVYMDAVSPLLITYKKEYNPYSDDVNACITINEDFKDKLSGIVHLVRFAKGA